MRRILPLFSALCASLLAALPVRAELDLYAKEMRDLRTAYLKEKAELVKTRREALLAVLQENLKAFQAMLEEKKVAGNISAMAAARQGISLFQQKIEELEKSGDFALPSQVRRELGPAVAACAEKKKPIDAAHAPALKALEERYRKQFAEQAAKLGGGDLSGDALEQKFQELIATEDKAPEPPAGQKKPGEGATPAAEGDGELIIGSSGEGKLWIPLARWFASVSDIEILRVRVPGRARPEKTTGEGVMGQPYESRYEPIRVVEPRAGFAYRVKKLPRLRPMEVLEWPKEANGWELVVRARPAGAPSAHGVEIEVSVPEGVAVPLASEAAATAPVAPDAPEGEALPKIDVPIRTTPPGAIIYVDGKLAQAGAESMKTPCTLPLTTKNHHLRLKKFGYHDAVLEQFAVQEGAAVSVALREDPTYADRTVQVLARNSWLASGLRLDENDRYIVTVTGKWSCGSGGEEVDSEGYPNDEKFRKYYLNPRAGPRQSSTGNYGALLMRIGRDGPMLTVGKGLQGKADRAGILYLDINEEDAPSARRDNVGVLTVRILKGPPKGKD